MLKLIPAGHLPALTYIMLFKNNVGEKILNLMTLKWPYYHRQIALLNLCCDTNAPLTGKENSVWTPVQFIMSTALVKKYGNISLISVLCT